MNTPFENDSKDAFRPMQRRKLTIEVDNNSQDMDCEQRVDTSKISPVGVLRPAANSEAIRIASNWAADGHELRSFYEASRRRVLWAFLEAQQAVEIARMIKGNETASERSESAQRIESEREAARRAEVLRAEVVASNNDSEGQTSKSHFCGWPQRWSKDSKIHSISK